MKAADVDLESSTVQETAKQMAANGDVEGLLQLIVTEKNRFVSSYSDLFPHLYAAMELRAHKDPVRFYSDVLGRMISFTAYLVLRSQFYLGTRLGQQGPLSSSQRLDESGLPTDFTEQQLPSLLQLHQHFLDLGRAHASTARLWQLARRKENDHKSAQGPTLPETGKNGHAAQTKFVPANNRIETGRHGL